MQLWKSMNSIYELDYDINMNWCITIKWLWNDYKMTMNSCMNFVDALYEMHYEKIYEIMIWIDYELSDFNYASSMKTYALMYEKYFSTSLIYENV